MDSPSDPTGDGPPPFGTHGGWSYPSHPVGDGLISQTPTGEALTFSDPMGEGPTSSDPTGEGPPPLDPTRGGPPPFGAHGGWSYPWDPMGEAPTSSDPAGNNPLASDLTGDGSTSLDPMGDGPPPSGPAGDGPPQTPGDGPNPWTTQVKVIPPRTPRGRSFPFGPLWEMVLLPQNPQGAVPLPQGMDRKDSPVFLCRSTSDVSKMQMWSVQSIRVRSDWSQGRKVSPVSSSSRRCPGWVS